MSDGIQVPNLHVLKQAPQPKDYEVVMADGAVRTYHMLGYQIDATGALHMINEGHVVASIPAKEWREAREAWWAPVKITPWPK